MVGGVPLVCLIVLLQGASSILFFVAARHSLAAEHRRNALAAVLLGLLVLAGAILLGLVVFQPPADLGQQFAKAATSHSI